MTDEILEKVLKIDGKVSVSHSFVHDLNRLKSNMKIGQMVNVDDLPKNAKFRILNYFSSGKLSFDEIKSTEWTYVGSGSERYRWYKQFKSVEKIRGRRRVCKVWDWSYSVQFSSFDENVHFDGCSISFEEYLTLKNPETDIINAKSFKGDVYIDCLDDFEIGIEQYRRVKNKMDEDIRKRFKKK